MTLTSDDHDRDILPGFPAFAQELAGTLAVNSQYVLHGNIRDQYLVPDVGTVRPTAMLPLLWQALRPSGYQCLIVSDQVDGIRVYPDEPEAKAAARQLLGPRVIGRKATLERLRSSLARVVGVPEPPPIDGDAVQADADQSGEAEGTPPSNVDGPRAAFVMDFAARITRMPGQLETAERDFFLFCQKLSLTARTRLGGPPSRPAALFNPVIWLVEGERDLPAWLTTTVERVRMIAVPRPSLDDRVRGARIFGRIIQRDLTAAEDKHLVEFANRTDDMTLQSMAEIARLAADRRIPLHQIRDAVRVYRLGIEDNPWRRGSVRAQISQGEKEVATKVIGQEAAVTRTLDILKRAALGLSGAQATTTGTRPRGTLFFAGPTGVGKTELAKQVAKILFGDPSAYLRFDMSEFSANHSADRLTGAPPGYVGYEAGGELTGAVRRKPFQVILFDEIEKAHPQVLDKFLQILEDGRLTDGQGTTTYFSECVIIFTSNLGIVVTDKNTGVKRQLVKPPIEYADLETRVKEAIRDHFTLEIGRPELLNRLGDNIVVFDFIKERAAAQILSLQLKNVVDRLHDELEVKLIVRPAAEATLLTECMQDMQERNHGGRGIGNQIESRLINPLARYLFDHDCQPGTTVDVRDVGVDASGVARLDVGHPA